MKRISIIGSFFTVTGIFLYFALISPLMADNYIFSRAIVPGFAKFYSGSPVIMEPMNLFAALSQATEMYFTWCGRFFGNLSVYLLFLLPSSLYALTSSLLFSFYIWLLALCIFGEEWRQKLNAGWVFGLASLLWLTIPAFGEAFFWLSVGGQLALLAQAIVFIPYRFSFNQKMPAWNVSTISGILFFLFCIVATSLDFASSAVLPPTAILTLLYLRYYKKKSFRKIKTLVFGAAGLTLGAILTLSAPGNAERLAHSNDIAVQYYIASPWLERIINWLIHLPGAALSEALPLIWLIWSLLVLKRNFGKKWLRHFPVSSLLFIIPAILTHCAYLFTAWPPPRAFATCSVQLIIGAAIVSNTAFANAAQKSTHHYKIAINLVFLLAFIIVAYESLQFWDLHNEVLAREKILKASENSTIILEPLKTSADRWQPLGGTLNDISEDPDFWVNRAMAGWYGVDKIIKKKNGSELVYKCAIENNFEQEIYDPRLTNMQVEIDKNKIAIQMPNLNDSHFENQISFYYDGFPGILGRLPRHIANWLRNLLKKYDLTGSWLLPILLARTDIKVKMDSPESKKMLSRPLNMTEKEKIWLLNPDKTIFSSDLIPFICKPEEYTDKPSF